MFTEKEKCMLKMATSYMLANLDDINETFEHESREDIIVYDNLLLNKITHNEVYGLISKLRNNTLLCL